MGLGRAPTGGTDRTTQPNVPRGDGNSYFRATGEFTAVDETTQMCTNVHLGGDGYRQRERHKMIAPLILRTVGS